MTSKNTLYMSFGLASKGEQKKPPRMRWLLLLNNM